LKSNIVTKVFQVVSQHAIRVVNGVLKFIAVAVDEMLETIFAFDCPASVGVIHPIEGGGRGRVERKSRHEV